MRIFPIAQLHDSENHVNVSKKESAMVRYSPLVTSVGACYVKLATDNIRSKVAAFSGNQYTVCTYLFCRYAVYLLYI